MKYTHKILLPILSLAALTFAACGGSETDNSAETAKKVEVTIPEAPEAAIQMIAKELASGNGEILWQAMPSSYQADLNSIAQLAGSKVDGEIYNQAFGLVSRLADIAEKQKQFVINTGMAGPRSPEEIAKIEEAYPSVIGLIKTLASSSISSVEKLQAFDGQTFFGDTVSTIIGYSEGLSEMGGEEIPLSAYKNVQVKALEATDTTAELELTAPDGEITTESFTKVEGRWVPAEMAADWSTEMADAKATLEAITPEQIAQNKPQIMGVITMLDGVLTQIESAETQEQFDQALQGAMMPIMGLMMMQQNMGGQMPTPTAP